MKTKKKTSRKTKRKIDHIILKEPNDFDKKHRRVYEGSQFEYCGYVVVAVCNDLTMWILRGDDDGMYDEWEYVGWSFPIPQGKTE